MTFLYLGWSVGGVLAYEVSRQLASTGINVSGLLLIDSPAPQTKHVLTDSVIDAVFSSKGKSPSKLRDLARSNIKSLTGSLVAYDHAKSPAHQFAAPRAVMLACSEGLTVEKIDSESTRWLADRRDSSQMVACWSEALQTEVPVLDIPGNHFEIFESRNVRLFPLIILTTRNNQLIFLLPLIQIEQVTQKLREALAMLV